MKFSPQGLAFPDADELMLQHLGPAEDYQLSHLDVALRYVTDFSCAVDGGAHVGVWTKAMAAGFQTVLAFEPSRDTFACLFWNLRDLKNVDAFCMALGAIDGFGSMVLDEVNAARANTGARHLERGDDIPIRPLDSLRLETCGLLKLDVEGCELYALKGARETLRRCQPIVLFEDKALWTKFYDLPRDAPQQFLLQLGYQHLARSGADEIWGPR